MCHILGIDTGGTFTDGVLINLSSKEIKAKAKAFTTPGDLTVGIRECIDNLQGLDKEKIDLVALSTTLATNSVVENRGSRVGLLLIGKEPGIKFPAQEIAWVQGGHDLNGRPVSDLDEEAVRKSVRAMFGKVDAVAISGLLSVRNPEHETMALRILKDEWDVPVVCAHWLSSALGFQERTVTACLNARLLPVIDELLKTVKGVLRERGINATLMIVKGDGSLMSEETAREKPIETILSGPAASILGATFITDEKAALVLDMGGTTTDIAMIEDGVPKLNPEGATVGGWKTRVEAANISTFAIGGDSYIQITQRGKIAVGPRRVWPLSAQAIRYPHLVEELKQVSLQRSILDGQPVDCWMLLKRPEENRHWDDQEWAVIRLLEDGAHNVMTIAEKLGKNPNLLPLAKLEDDQVIGRISLTPTDLLHASGCFTLWSVEAATEAAKVQSRRLGMTLENFLTIALREVDDKLNLSVIQSLFYQKGLDLNLDDTKEKFFLDRILGREADRDLSVKLALKVPIIAIGAPAEAYIPKMAEMFKTKVLVPRHADVANAIGAATGQVVESIKILITPGRDEPYIVHAPWGREIFPTLKAAEKYAREKGEELVRANITRAGVLKSEIISSKNKKTYQGTFLESEIKLMAIGRP
ncbi:hydantoinase/oxoprolinase family protein [Desulfosporosinus sp. PR]|uniref:hydantoinase/oxoprolinase family protein n=1 Tax=Candidatus Desulfosporosinus nitrosoreducens TaxID=3401928 RepID=UPI0027F04341|nr:hydantoinase/oxoprolinase family protein [Desulfosporosinus sp. PR]MDQ7096112.1 hydantoinase/oxoprolinase family protein [Desulfosporosinus sp. PR]